MTLIRFEREPADRMLRTVDLLLSDLRPFWPLVVPLVTGWWRRQFETEGGFAGRPWTALSPVYGAWKSENFPDRGILYGPDRAGYQGGALRRAASRPSRLATPHTLTLTIDDPKVAFHQEGTPRMPARPLIFGDPLPAEAAGELQAAADRYVGDFLRRF